jgi:hypothetical protein
MGFASGGFRPLVQSSHRNDRGPEVGFWEINPVTRRPRKPRQRQAATLNGKEIQNPYPLSDAHGRPIRRWAGRNGGADGAS